MRISTLLLTLLLLQACSSAVLRVESEPSGATVYLESKAIGNTPLELKAQDYKQEFSQPFLNLKLSMRGYEPQSLLVATHEAQAINIKLSKFDSPYFENTILSDFQSPTNEMVREILQIQGLIFAKQNDQAQQKLNQFSKKYPNIAASYVLQANLEISKNQTPTAISNLERALTLDPTDAVIARMLENLKKKDVQ